MARAFTVSLFNRYYHDKLSYLVVVLMRDCFLSIKLYNLLVLYMQRASTCTVYFTLMMYVLIQNAMY